MLVSLLLLALAGLITGALGAMLGVGGGFILVPMLTVLYGVPIHSAVAAGQIGVIATSTVATVHYLKQDLVHLHLAYGLLFAATVGAAIGALVGSRLDERILAGIFGMVLAWVALRMIRGQNIPDDPDATVATCRPVHWWVGQAGALFGGTLGGLLGIGGGVVNVPLLCMGMRVPLRLAGATSIFLVGITGASAAAVYYSRGYTDLIVCGATVLGAFAGSWIGARLASRIQSSYLRIAFGVVAAYTGITMIVRAVGPSL
ncbi:MAG: sulfite exporter TauE/SafE family protein [Anaerolineae bacterium]|nr:sulfite exporter TauE/SafE family protein [Anaerolineae bacterium]